MKHVRWMVFFGVDSSHVHNSVGEFFKRFKDAEVVYEKINTQNYGSKCKMIKRLEFVDDWNPATSVKIVKKNF